ncbi:MAG TPA: ATP-binding protein [Gammaproteobacteria bacterium]
MPQKHFIERHASKTLRRLSRAFPIIGLTGPRQAGKTTLAQHHYPRKPYVSLENPDQLDFARSDPKGFLAQFPKGAILDEVQRCPSLFSYLQGLVDARGQMGQFVLTGSQQFGFRAQLSQTLAGRIGLIHLLPFSLPELNANGRSPLPLNEQLWKGFYPPMYDRDIQPNDWYANYTQTYIERDVQQLIQIKDLNTFRTFLRICAGRAGQIINLSGIGNDCGISHNTVKEWLSVLEAGYIIFRLPPHFKNFSKRLIKSPKLYFYDTGLLCWLLGVKQPDQLSVNPLRGAIFENFVISEVLKTQYANGDTPGLYFWRDNLGLEIDLIIDRGQTLIPVEIKAGQTISQDFMKNLEKWKALAGKTAQSAFLVHGGEQAQKRTAAHILSWNNLEPLLSKLA